MGPGGVRPRVRHRAARALRAPRAAGVRPGPTLTLAEPARFDFTPDQARSLGRGFLAFYAGLAALLLVGGIWSEPLRVLGPVFVVVVALWWWQIRRAPVHPWSLVVGEDEVVLTRQGTTSTARRDDVHRVRARRRTMRHAAWTELVFDGPGLVVGPSGADVPAILAALRARGWPVR